MILTQLKLRHGQDCTSFWRFWVSPLSLFFAARGAPHPLACGPLAPSPKSAEASWAILQSHQGDSSSPPSPTFKNTCNYTEPIWIIFLFQDQLIRNSNSAHNFNSPWSHNITYVLALGMRRWTSLGPIILPSWMHRHVSTTMVKILNSTSLQND